MDILAMETVHVNLVEGKDFERRLKEGYTGSEEAKEILKEPTDGSDNYRLENEFICRVDESGPARLYVPPTNGTREDILQLVHDSPTGDHMMANKTLDALTRLYYWPGMRATVKDYIRSCEASWCQAAKSSTRKPLGLLYLLDISEEPWESVSMDFTGPHPVVKGGNNFIVVFVDRFTEMVHIRATKQSITAPQTADLFYEAVIVNHGVPKKIISDGDPRFTGLFWKALSGKLGINLKMYSSRHPETDGKTERVNYVIGDTLRATEGDGASWDCRLPAIEFAINSHKHVSTGYSPFQLYTGRQPPGLETALHRSITGAAVENPAATNRLLEIIKVQRRAKEDRGTRRHEAGG